MSAAARRAVLTVLPTARTLAERLELYVEAERHELPLAGVAARYACQAAQVLERSARQGARIARGETARPGKYDPAARRRGVRRGAERGCWLFVPADELVKAGIDPYAEAPWYRCWGSSRGGLVVRFYKEG